MLPTHPQYEIISSPKPVNLFMGGYGSGKTKVMGDLSLIFVTNFPHIIGLIAANTYGQLNRSTMRRVKEVWAANGIVEYNEKTGKGNYVTGKRPPSRFKATDIKFDDYSSIVSFENGATIFMGSLDNYAGLDGMEVGWGMLDETKDTKKDAMGVILGRLRQKGLYLKSTQKQVADQKRGDFGVFTAEPNNQAINPLYVFTAPAKVDWLNEFFRVDELPPRELQLSLYNEPHYAKFDSSNMRRVFCSTYSNEHNLPNTYINNLLSTLESHLTDRLVHGYPFASEGGEFYHAFNAQVHVKNVGYDASLPLHISFDENVTPYAPCGIWQVHGKTARKIKEIHLKEPRNNIHEVCYEIERLYLGHMADVYIYGDATSNKRDAKLAKEDGSHVTFYTIIKKALRMLNPRMRVPSANPVVSRRGWFINSILEKNIYGIRIEIDPSCVDTKKDYEQLKKNGDDGKDKSVVKDPLTGASFQPLGHASDLDDYFICEYFKNEYQAFLKSSENTNQIAPIMGGARDSKRFR